MARRFLPELRDRLRNSIESKALPDRVRASATHQIRPGQPYSEHWPVSRAVQQGYEVNLLIYRCIEVIAENAIDRNIVLRQGDPDTGDELSSDPSRLLYVFNRRANPWETARIFRHRLIAQFLLSKRGVFVEVVRTRSGAIGTLNLLDPDLVDKVPTETDPIASFRIRTPTSNSGQPFDYLPRFDPDASADEQPSSVLWLRKPHPTVMWNGMTAIQAAGATIELDHYARLYNRRFLQQDGRPGGLISIKGLADRDTQERIQAQFQGGPESAGKTNVITADDLSYVDTSGTPRDTMWGDTMDRARRDILTAFGVPETLVGDSSGRTFDNADSEKTTFWEERMGPFLRALDDQLDVLTGAGGDDDIWLRHDLSDVWVLGRRDRDEADRAAADLQRGAITIDEYRQRLGLDPMNTPASQVLWIDAGKLAVHSDEQTAEDAAAAPKGGTPNFGAFLSGGDEQGSDGGPQPPQQPAPGGNGQVPTQRRNSQPRNGARQDAATATEQPAADERRERRDRSPANATEGKALDDAATDTTALDVTGWQVDEVSPDPPSGPDREALIDREELRQYRVDDAITTAIESWLTRVHGVVTKRMSGPKARKGTRWWVSDTKAALALADVETKAVDAEQVYPDKLTTELGDAVRPVALRIAHDAAASTARRLGVDPEPQGDDMFAVDENYIRDRVADAVERILGVAERHAGEVRDAILAADSDADTLDEVLDRIAEAHRRGGNWVLLAGRDAMHSLDTATAHEAAEQLGAVSAQWISQRDDRVRATHRVADGQRRPLDERFQVGGFRLAYPGDPAVLPEGGEEVYGCRCFLIYDYGTPERQNALAVLPAIGAEPGAAGAAERLGPMTGTPSLGAEALQQAVEAAAPDTGVPSGGVPVTTPETVVGWRSLESMPDWQPGQATTLAQDLVLSLTAPTVTAARMAVIIPAGVGVTATAGGVTVAAGTTLGVLTATGGLLATYVATAEQGQP